MTWTPAMEAELAMLIHRAVRAQARKLSSCHGKHGYHSPKEAERAMPRRDLREHLSVYHCRDCHLWHIGSDTPRRVPGRVVKQRLIEQANAMDSEL